MPVLCMQVSSGEVVANDACGRETRRRVTFPYDDVRPIATLALTTTTVPGA